jgi:hypothetical protein
VKSAFRSYQIRIRGVASDLVRAAFDDVEVSHGSGQTVLRTGPVDSATLYGLISRIESLGLVLMGVEAIDVGQSGGPAASRVVREGKPLAVGEETSRE